MKILFVGESWNGSCARSLREALERQSPESLEALDEDGYFPKTTTFVQKVRGRLFRPIYRRKLVVDVLKLLRSTKIDVFMTYKGYPIRKNLIQQVRAMGVMTINVYPDYSPHAYGEAHRSAVGAYDMVISTKEYHPELWSALYGYSNECRFVPQGYDPLLHCRGDAPQFFEYDVVMIATYREEYGKLILELADLLGDRNIHVAIGGNGWSAIADSLPSHWSLPGAVHGDDYVSLLRSGKVCIAPLNREVVIGGVHQPGDVDTTRSYELAASYCFFIHQRTDYVSGLYGNTGAPMFDDATELADHIRYFLAHAEERVDIAKRTHELAVPDFSLDARAVQIKSILKDKLDTHFDRCAAVTIDR